MLDSIFYLVLVFNEYIRGIVKCWAFLFLLTGSAQKVGNAAHFSCPPFSSSWMKLTRVLPSFPFQLTSERKKCKIPPPLLKRPTQRRESNCQLASWGGWQVKRSRESTIRCLVNHGLDMDEVEKVILERII